ncbi:pyrroline-5-carboxylate reductase [Candidatus Clostridium stratigraminis]|uniref:Pyrroline-5-carboxylate reductase n=1 Tax=Candidatus Clostridium stratigraminis TaxID=3381661 RepID=A0ABW8T2K1_9CLOT
MNKRIGFIGCGNMAQAMIGGIVKSNIVPKEDIIGSNSGDKNLNITKEKFGILTTHDNKEVAAFSDILILAVKPHIYPSVIGEIKNVVKKDAVIVTIAAGISIAFMEKAFGNEVKVVRTMPNTPAMVGEGMSALCPNNKVSKEELNEVIEVYNSFGKAELIEERLMDYIPAVSGSSPAYVYMFIEALADGAVRDGIPREKAYKFAAQAVLGAAKMVLESGMHPGALKDNVCSPGGTTIEAVYSLEKNNFRGTVIDAMKACTDKTVYMSKNNG